MYLMGKSIRMERAKEAVQNLARHTDQDVQCIGVAPITQLRTCVVKIETSKGGHLMW